MDSHYGMDEHATEPPLVDGGTYECPVNSCKEPRSSWASGLELIFAGKFGGSCDIFIHVYTCFYKYLFSWHCHSSKLRVWGRSSSASSAGRLFAPASLHKVDLQTQAILNIMQHRTVNCIVLISFNSSSASEIANNAGDVQEKSILNLQETNRSRASNLTYSHVQKRLQGQQLLYAGSREFDGRRWWCA